MKKKSLFAITTAASFALLASACGGDDKKTNNPSGPTDDPNVPCDTCVVPPPPTESKSILIDNFEDGDGNTEQGKGWYVYNDKENGGASVINTPLNEDGYPTAFEEGYESNYSFKAEYTLDKGDYEYDPYVAIAVAISPDDYSQIGGIHYCYKGGAHTVRVETSDVRDYDVHGTKMLASTANWKCVDIKFRDLVQEGWGKHVEFDSENINQISFHIKGSAKVTTGSLMIDNVIFLHNDELPADVPDLVKNEAVIPAVTIGDVAISNPLQEKAMKYLNKGINFTNWLENADGKFDGKFMFGEKDIKLLSEYGFKALRLPIDLDLYANNRKAYLADTTDAVALEFDDEALFTVLDSFDVWTKKYGMSLDIDYHEYDNSYNKTSSTDERYIKMMAEVWKHVAAHYAESEREDLFYELLNEPDMTSGAVTPANWTKAAQAMIDAIRSVDTKHTIIFGDAKWYSIDLLAKRTPFTDDNIVYAIHTYAPMLFTHQGGSWTDYAAIHNIPFPYVAEEWSEFSSTYGVNAGVISGVKNEIKNYYKTGSKEAILQAVVKAKDWAVTNNVPVIINEFGALRDKSDAQSVLNYYKAMIDICDTLQIPWTHWGYTGGFSVVDNSGKLYEGLADVMKLEAK